jgi:hypothetical protein
MVAAAQYPIPPAAQPSPSAAAPEVPTWAFRRTAPIAVGPQFVGDLAIDPQSLRSRLTVRAGLSSLTVDDDYLTLRTGFRRHRIPWEDVHGFERQDAPGDERGQLSARTAAEPVPLPATARPVAELGYLHALLEAYRVRAQQLSHW